MIVLFLLFFTYFSSLAMEVPKICVEKVEHGIAAEGVMLSTGKLCQLTPQILSEALSKGVLHEEHVRTFYAMLGQERNQLIVPLQSLIEGLKKLKQNSPDWAQWLETMQGQQFMLRNFAASSYGDTLSEAVGIVRIGFYLPGATEAVKDYLRCQPDVKEKIDKGEFAHFLCCTSVPFMEYLRTIGLTFDTCDTKGRTWLMLALSCNDKVDTYLIEKAEKFNLDLEARDLEGKSALDHLRELQAVYRNIKNEYNIRLLKGWKQLHFAASEPGCTLVEREENKAVLAAMLGSRKKAEDLLKQGVDKENQTKSGKRPLHIAARSNNLEVVELLLQADADFEAVDKKMMRPLHYAARQGNEKIVQLLLTKGAGVECQDQDMMRPLHYAARFPEVTRLLVAHKASVEARDKNGRTPLHYAVNSDVLKILVKAQALLTAEDTESMKPIHFATILGDDDMVAILGSNLKRAELEVQDKKGLRPVHYAAQNGSLEIMKLLVKRNVDKEAQDHARKRPLHYAAQAGSLSVLKYLLQQGVDKEALDASGKKALDYANEGGHKEEAEALNAQLASNGAGGNGHHKLNGHNLSKNGLKTLSA